jgi:hypothetical protein
VSGRAPLHIPQSALVVELERAFLAAGGALVRGAACTAVVPTPATGGARVELAAGDAALSSTMTAAELADRLVQQDHPPAVPREITCDHVIIATGASCDTLGPRVGGGGFSVRYDGRTGVMRFLNVHFTSAQLADRLARDPAAPSMLSFVFNADALGCIITHSLARGEFVLQVPDPSLPERPHGFDVRVGK